MPNIITLLGCIGTKTKVIISERNDPSQYKVIYKILTRLFYGLTDKMVFQSERVRLMYPKRIRSKGRIIMNPVSISTYADIPKHKFVSVGRLEPQKNQRMLINAFSEFVKTHPDYTLYIYGEGSLRQELEIQIQNNGLESKVFLPGNMSDIHEHIKDAKGFILSSNYEGLSNALLEAMMMGIPCVSTNCAGSDEVITNYQNGILVQIDNVQEMKSAMLTLAEDDALCERMSISAKAKMEDFKVEKILQQWTDVIET